VPLCGIHHHRPLSPHPAFTLRRSFDLKILLITNIQKLELIVPFLLILLSDSVK
jgi:hypothetical protein